MAGFLPGFGRGGIIHSFVGPSPIGLFIGAGDGAIINGWFCGIGLMASVGGAGAIFAGDPALVGVLAAEYIAGDAMV